MATEMPWLVGFKIAYPPANKTFPGQEHMNYFIN